MSASIGRHARRHPGPVQDQPLNINYGHNGSLVVLQFTRTTAQIVLSIKQTDDMLEALQKVKAMLIEHQAKARNG